MPLKASRTKSGPVILWQCFVIILTITTTIGYYNTLFRTRNVYSAFHRGDYI